MRDWRRRGLTELVTATNALNADMTEDQLLAGIHPVYTFLRKAQILENPLVIIANAVGLEKVTKENLEVLRNYVKNGGFIWIDDTGVATAECEGPERRGPQLHLYAHGIRHEERAV